MTYLSRHRSTIGQLSLFGALAAAVWFAAGPAKALDPRAIACGANARTTLVASFDMPSARDIHAHIPSLGTLPELDSVATPAHVVVVGGPVTFPAFVHESLTYKNAVCVFVGDAEPIVYADVDLAGLTQ